MKRPSPALSFALALAMVGGAAGPSLAQGESDPTSTRPAGEIDLQQAGIDRLEKFYARLYGEPQNFETRLGGLVSVISLSRFAGDPLTEHLVTAANRSDPLVALTAWDALAARADRLDDDQAAAWRKAGVDLATGRNGGDVFLGRELRPLLLALAAQPAEAEVDAEQADAIGDLVNRAVRQNDFNDESGRQTLEAAGQLILARGDASLARRLVDDVQRPGPLGDRAHVVLSQLPHAPARDAARAEWNAWIDGLTMTPAPRAYDGGSIWFEEPTVITDSTDEQFRQEMELGKLNLSGVDVAFAIDATPSLTTSNPYIQGYLGVMTQTLSVLSDNIRIGVCYYRHEVRPELQVDCCRDELRRAQQNEPKRFLVDTIPLTNNFNGLLATMNVDRLPTSGAGHEGLGALAAGLEGAFVLLQQMSRPDAARVIILQGDANPTKGTDQALVKMAGLAKEAGVITSLLIRDGSTARNLNPVAQAASGNDAISYRDDLEAVKEGTVDPFADFASKPFGQVATQIISAALPDSYADRGPQVVKIVAGHLYTAREAQRVSVR